MAHRTLAVAILSLVTAGAAPAADAEPVKFADQGWSRELRELFYFTPQGSKMIPYDWFMALEQPAGGGHLPIPPIFSATVSSWPTVRTA